MAPNRAKSGKTGVLLVNLGSPVKPTRSAVRKYLKEFLWDPRVVNLPRFVWWLILHLVVLPFRPGRAAKAYQTIWTENGSPLVFQTQRLALQLAERLGCGDEIFVDYAMRYSQPGMVKKLRLFKEQGVSRLIVIPLYPQYSSTTTASVYDMLSRELATWRYVPSLHFVTEYYDHADYIQALADSVEQFWQQHGNKRFLLMSFHGLPAKLTELGDPYFFQCQQTASLLAAKLGLSDTQWKLVFQSRFGKAEWLKPYCVEVLESLPEQGHHCVDIICPGFAVDCLETLEEIAMANREAFISAGGVEYRYIPALNDSCSHVDFLHDLIKPLLR